MVFVAPTSLRLKWFRLILGDFSLVMAVVPVHKLRVFAQRDRTRQINLAAGTSSRYLSP
jgi:hypothetical protein